MSFDFNRYEERCAELGLSPNKAAKQAGIAPSTVTKWRHGSVPENGTIRRVALVLNVTEDWLCGGEQKHDSTSGEPWSEATLAVVRACEELQTTASGAARLQLLREQAEEYVRIVRSVNETP